MVTPRSARRKATDLLRIELPRSACTVSWSGSMSCLRQLSAMRALRERGTFSVSQHPANHVAGEDVEDDVEVVVGPLDGATKLRYIPRPNLVGRFGQQLRLGVVRMAPFGSGALGPRRAPPKSDTSCESSRDKCPRPKAWPTPGRAALSTNRSQCKAPRTSSRSVSSRARCGRGRRFGLDVADWRLRYKRGTSHTQSLAGFRRLPNPPRQLLGRLHQSFS